MNAIVTQRIGQTRQNNIRVRNSKIREMVNDMYQNKKLRLDYTYEVVAEAFSLSVCTIGKIMKSRQ